MSGENSPLSIKQCAEKFNRKEGDIERALVTLGLYTRVTKGMRIDKDKIFKLSDYFNKQKKQQATHKDTASVGGVRKISTTEVTERKTRGRLQRPRLSLEEIRQKKSPPPPAEVVAEPEPTPGPKKTVQIKKIAPQQPAAVEPAAAATDKEEEAKSAPPPKAKAAKAVKAAKKSVKKTAAPKSKSSSAAAKAKPSAPPADEAPVADEVPVVDEAPVADAAPPAVPEDLTTSVSTAVKEKPAAAKDGKSDARYDVEKLLSQQIAHREQMAQKQKQQQEATAAAVKSKKEAEKPVKKKKEGTIKLDKTVLDEYKKKRKKNITRSEAREKISENQHTFIKPTAPVVREIEIPQVMSVSKLANEVALKSSVIIRKLMEQGMMVTANELLDKETAWIIVEELGHCPVDAPDNDMEKELLKSDIEGSDIQPRAPVVTVMGHVDHGKTSLLDYIRKTRVAAGEAGGITQHIGSYRVDTAIGPVTFLDTPGHELFSQIRARGAKITDIVVLVVAADDGVKPQTIEAINHAKAANVTLIVAANKIDKPEANLDRVKRELAEQNVLPEDWGGDTMVIPISATTGEGIDKLLEALAIQTELLELSAPLDVPATGVVVEARVDKGRGIVASLVITHGVLKCGQAFLCGTQSGRVRTMWNLSHAKLEEAGPSMPVEIQGLSGIPEAGAKLQVVEAERTAREIAEMRQSKSRLRKMVSHHHLPTGSDKAALLLDSAEKQEWRELNVVVKADVEGSREALAAALSAISGKNAGVKIIHSAVGTVTESDIYLTQTSGGIIVAFNVRPDSRTRKLSESRGIKIIVGNVVYDLVEKVKSAVLGLLAPIIEENIIGTAAVQEVFNISNTGNIAGCLIKEGVARSKSPVRLLRDQAMVYAGTMASLYHYKNQASEVRAGSECGIGIANFNDIKVGDTIEILERTETAPEM